MPHLRCTICTWRGSLEEAVSSPVQAKTDLPSHLLVIQDAYEEVQRFREKLGETRPPPCPRCGHHITSARRTTYHRTG